MLLLIVMAVVSGVSLSCSSDEYDEPMGLKTMARRKAKDGPEDNVIPADRATIPVTNLPCACGSFSARVKWETGNMDNFPAVSLEVGTFDNVTYRKGFLFQLLEINGDMKDRVYVTGIELDPRESSFQFEGSEINSLKIKYDIPYTVYLLKADDIHANDSSSCESTSDCYKEKSGEAIKTRAEGYYDVNLNSKK